MRGNPNHTIRRTMIRNSNGINFREDEPSET